MFGWLMQQELLTKKQGIRLMRTVYATLSHLRSKQSPGLQLGSDYIDVEAEINCGDRLILT